MATFKATSEDTGGAYTITEDTFPPQVGPPPHIHHTQEETFYVLEGEMEFVTDGVTTRTAGGSLVRIPRGVLRDYRNVGSELARVLVLYAPGGFEGFFEEVGELVTGHSAPRRSARCGEAGCGRREVRLRDTTSLAGIVGSHTQYEKTGVLINSNWRIRLH